MKTKGKSATNIKQILKARRIKIDKIVEQDETSDEVPTQVIIMEMPKLQKKFETTWNCLCLHFFSFFLSSSRQCHFLQITLFCNHRLARPHPANPKTITTRRKSVSVDITLRSKRKEVYLAKCANAICADVFVLASCHTSLFSFKSVQSI
jgi:hypothetical protein